MLFKTFHLRDQKILVNIPVFMNLKLGTELEAWTLCSKNTFEVGRLIQHLWNVEHSHTPCNLYLMWKVVKYFNFYVKFWIPSGHTCHIWQPRQYWTIRRMKSVKVSRTWYQARSGEWYLIPGPRYLRRRWNLSSKRIDWWELGKNCTLCCKVIKNKPPTKKNIYFASNLSENVKSLLFQNAKVSLKQRSSCLYPNEIKSILEVDIRNKNFEQLYKKKIFKVAIGEHSSII